MRLANLVALAFCVGALGLFLLGLIFAAVPILKDPAEIAESVPNLGESQTQIMKEGLEAYSAWAFSLVLFLFLAAPAAVLAAVGTGIWYFIGRRQDEELERKIAWQESEESLLQEFVGGVIEEALAPEGRRDQAISRGSTQLLPKLDPLRRRRLAIFLREGGLASETIAQHPAPRVASRRPLVRIYPTLVKVVVSSLALAGVLVMLWGLATLVLLGASDSARQYASQRSGTEFDSAAMVVGGFMGLAIALLPLAAAAGIWWLQRRELRLHERWRTSRQVVQERLLDFCRGWMERLAVAGGQEGTGKFASVRAIVRGLALMAFPELDRSGRLRLIESLRHRGVDVRELEVRPDLAELAGPPVPRLSP